MAGVGSGNKTAIYANPDLLEEMRGSAVYARRGYTRHSELDIQKGSHVDTVLVDTRMVRVGASHPQRIDNLSQEQ